MGIGILGLSSPMKSIGSSFCGVSSKRDHSVVNNSMQLKGSYYSRRFLGTMCNAVFCHSLTTRYCYCQRTVVIVVIVILVVVVSVMQSISTFIY